jgi:hypothetical protein
MSEILHVTRSSFSAITLACLLCSSVLAQNPGAQNGNVQIRLSALPQTTSASDGREEPQPGRLLIRLPGLLPAPNRAPGRTYLLSPADLPNVKPPRFVIKNLAAFIVIDSLGMEIYLPMAGGGQTGCFWIDSEEPSSEPVRQGLSSK